VVFAGRIAEDILLHYPAGVTNTIVERPAGDSEGKNETPLMPKLRKIMSQYVGVSRNGEGLRTAIKEIDALEKENKSFRFRNALTTAKLAAVCALLREESRGGHQRSDFPNEVDEWKKRSFISLPYADKLVGKVLEGKL
jgi:L-aspartate oxidase